MPESGTERLLSKEQKTGFVLLLLFAVLMLIAGGLQLRNTIYTPFVVRAPENTNINDLLQDEDILLQAIDTDQDGLNDFEEIEFYQTSRFIPDTDSDGISDKEEIDAGTDPLCAEGSDCSILLGDPRANDPQIGLDIPTPPTPEEIVGIVNPEDDVPDVESVMNDPEQIRELIFKTGQLTREQLDAIDDETLLNLVKNIFPEDTANSEEALAASSSTP